MTILSSFHNDIKIKEKYISRVKAHKLADEIIKGQYWENGKGCAVGCTIHGSNHKDYETELGIPLILAKLEDGIFESLPYNLAKDWPLDFLESIPVGVDLSNIWPQFAIWLLTDKKHGVLQYAKNKKQKIAIEHVGNLYLNYKIVTKGQWRVAAAAAYAAADAAAAAAYAADAAAYAADAAAAYAANADAAYAADAAAAAADGAYAAAAYAADAYADANANAWTNHRLAQSEKLLELLRNAQ